MSNAVHERLDRIESHLGIDDSAGQQVVADD